MWQAETISNVDTFDVKDSVYKLAENAIAAVRIPNVFTGEELDTIVGNIGQQGLVWYPNFEYRQGRIGIGATEYASKINGKEAYFLLEAESSKVRDKIFPDSLDPIARITDIFSQGFDTSLAEEPALDHAKYFTGLIRAMGQESTTHFDYAPHQLPGWSVSETKTQLSVVTYLQPAGKGGELTIFNRQWEPKDEEHNRDVDEKGPKGFEHGFLTDEESTTLQPGAGEMIVFNSRNFHKVQSMVSSVARLSVNSFMNLSEDDKLYLWN